IIFVMMASVISTRERLESIIRLTVICGAILAFFAIKSYAMGSFDLRGIRIVGLVKGIFENPNDLATALCMLFPLAIVLMLNRKGFKRFFYLGCVLVIVLGIFATFSRGGFLGVFAVCLFMAWKFGGKRRVPNLIGAAILLVGILMVLPGGYRNRVVTIFNSDQDETGSAQARTELLHRGIEVFMRRPIVGVGMGNFHIFSVHEHVAHNGYVEIAAELGIFGLLAYLTIIIKPFRRLLRVEKDLKGSTTDSDRWLRYLNIGLQAQLVAYIVTSFFLSIEYLWYLYYAAAYAIVLQQIHLNERAKEPVLESPALPVEDQSKALALRPKKNEGALWSS
ncbi:MAG TPA: O-antigen ligase family protein, partial [Blastocatellia bacterium]|nr:O-antigen ligase family protein [Blastocatellia bacterium]